MAIRRVLIVDDEIELLESTESGEDELLGYMGYYIAALQDSGIEVIASTGADEALAQLNDQPSFDLVILDLMMPPGQSLSKEETASGMRTGLKLAERIHADHPTMPIVILSNNVPSDAANSPRNDCQELVDRGVVKKVLFKPDTTPFDFVERIQSLKGTMP